MTTQLTLGIYTPILEEILSIVRGLKSTPQDVTNSSPIIVDNTVCTWFPLKWKLSTKASEQDPQKMYRQYVKYCRCNQSLLNRHELSYEEFLPYLIREVEAVGGKYFGEKMWNVSRRASAPHHGVSRPIYSDKWHVKLTIVIDGVSKTITIGKYSDYSEACAVSDRAFALKSKLKASGKIRFFEELWNEGK